jgi:OOP family OmpA-OmpF porin
LILQGKTLEEILPANYKKEITKPAEQTVAAVQQTPEPVSQPAPAAAPPVQPKQRSLPAPKPVDVASPAQKKVVLTEQEFEMPNVVILFDFDKSDITEEEMVKLRTAINKYKQVRNQYSISISGHTDNYGSLEYNYALSDRRNKAIINAVSEMLGEKISIPALSKSYTLPVADNSTDRGRQLNRRVELVFIKKK